MNNNISLLLHIITIDIFQLRHRTKNILCVEAETAFTDLHRTDRTCLTLSMHANVVIGIAVKGKYYILLSIFFLTMSYIVLGLLI